MWLELSMRDFKRHWSVGACINAFSFRFFPSPNAIELVWLASNSIREESGSQSFIHTSGYIDYMTKWRIDFTFVCFHWGDDLLHSLHFHLSSLSSKSNESKENWLVSVVPLCIAFLNWLLSPCAFITRFSGLCPLLLIEPGRSSLI